MSNEQPFDFQPYPEQPDQPFPTSAPYPTPAPYPTAATQYEGQDQMAFQAPLPRQPLNQYARQMPMNQWPNQFPTPMPMPMPGPAPRRPGILGLILGPALAVLAPIAGIALLVSTALPMTQALYGSHQFTAAQTPVTATLEAGEAQGLWMTGTGQPLACTVTDPAGAVLPWQTTAGNMTVNQFDLAAQFTPTVTGTHTITCPAEAGTNATFTIAPTLGAGSLVGSILGGVGLILGGIFGGLAILIISLIRRARWKRLYGGLNAA